MILEQRFAPVAHKAVDKIAGHLTRTDSLSS
jgi:hypothetical protein